MTIKPAGKLVCTYPRANGHVDWGSTPLNKRDLGNRTLGLSQDYIKGRFYDTNKNTEKGAKE